MYDHNILYFVYVMYTHTYIHTCSCIYGLNHDFRFRTTFIKALCNYYISSGDTAVAAVPAPTGPQKPASMNLCPVPPGYKLVTTPRPGFKLVTTPRLAPPGFAVTTPRQAPAVPQSLTGDWMETDVSQCPLTSIEIATPFRYSTYDDLMLYSIKYPNYQSLCCFHLLMNPKGS